MKKEFTLHMGERPVKPGKSRRFSPSGGKKLVEYINSIKSSGKDITKEEFDFNLEHLYYEDQINLNIETENYEECGRLLKIKNDIVQQEGETPFNIV